MRQRYLQDSACGQVVYSIFSVGEYGVLTNNCYSTMDTATLATEGIRMAKAEFLGKVF